MTLWHHVDMPGRNGTVTFTSWDLVVFALALAWLVAALVTGGPLGGPSGALVAAGASLVPSLLATGPGRRVRAWVWAHGTRSAEDFLTDRSAAAVVAATNRTALVRKGWRVTETDPGTGTVVISTRPTLFTWTKRITVSARPAADGTVVTVGSACPQFYDWGENRRVVADLRRGLQSVQGRIADDASSQPLLTAAPFRRRKPQREPGSS